MRSRLDHRELAETWKYELPVSLELLDNGGNQIVRCDTSPSLGQFAGLLQNFSNPSYGFLMG